MAVHVPLKNEFTEDEKYHNLMSWLILEFYSAHFQVYLSLLKIYIKPPEPKVLGLSEYQYEPKPNYSAAIALLEEHPASIDPIKVNW